MTLGEGAAILVLEELGHARARGATIYAEFLGYSTVGEAYHMTSPEASGREQSRTMGEAMNAAHISPGEVDYINAHGTGTPLGDVAEARAINELFGSAAQHVAVSTTKSSIGHLLGSSGAVELIACIMGINKSVAPPTINLDNPDERCTLRHVANHPQDMRMERALSNSFGFGGHNACIVVSALR